MDPFSEQTSAFDADPASSLPSAQDLIGDSIDAETHEEPAPAAAASSFPPVFAMPDTNDAFSAASPLPTLVDSTPLRFALESTHCPLGHGMCAIHLWVGTHSEWEEKHAEELTAKSKDETERHQKILEEAVADVEELNNQRAARIEAKRKQNKFVQHFTHSHCCT